jgi:hypothetical protein
VTLAVLLAALAVVCGAFGAAWERARPGAGRWAFVALGSAAVLQVVLGASPLMVVSDAVFHANNLGRVAGGDYFLTSVTQHARPFRFPYGVSFYALLVPVLRAGVDAVALVRWGAARGPAGRGRGCSRCLVPRGARAGGARGGRPAAPARHVRRAVVREPVERVRAGRDRAVRRLVVGSRPRDVVTGASSSLWRRPRTCPAFVVARRCWRRRSPVPPRGLAPIARAGRMVAGLLASGAYYASFVPLATWHSSRGWERRRGGGEASARRCSGSS